MDPLVSIRLSLRWPPDPPTADEDVLVVQGRSGFFLDLRVKRRQVNFAGGLQRQAKAGEGDCEVTWATAGWKEVLAPRPGEDRPRARFTPVIDSRRPASSTRSRNSPPPDTPPDEGSFETLTNGDVLERGEMENPETGKVAQYEEVWRRLPLSQDDGPPRIVIFESVGDEADGKAFVGRVGDYELGMVDGAEGFGVVRRERKEGIWQVVCANGAGRLLPTLDGAQEYAEGDTVQLAGRAWRVIEST
ncbi:hypothetical protein NBRC10512_007088 [Rhodotorula toruloides]|uniref:RHTO0S16e03840g1_1 n=2 Tax=Rhodotorula toruloides TaxID=5286 RepID=A0A061BFT9_RHOTO|nr:uncharacterized protein RHTO_02325 [Rhodotorula toruloides NP11]EMS21063.1 hypothetical protein RHTO_02325 [Rhodotorula toruloides NP11]CDR48220.1 RHTO0S16e03840g1_1 [Rhodotorula toruloides]